MKTAGGSWIPEAPSLGDIFEHTLSGPITWIFGSTVSAVVIGVVLTGLALKTWRDLLKEGRGILKGGKGILTAAAGAARSGVARTAQARQSFSNQLRELTAVQIAATVTKTCLRFALKIAGTGLVVAGQVLWLQITLWFVPSMAVLWNLLTWGSWELHGDERDVVAGYYASVGGVLLIIGWLVAVIARETDVAMTVTAVLGVISIVLPLLLVVPALLLLVFGTGLSILLSLLSFVIGASGAEWENIGGLWLYILGIFAYVAGSFAAVLSPGLVPAIWRRKAA